MTQPKRIEPLVWGTEKDILDLVNELIHHVNHNPRSAVTFRAELLVSGQSPFARGEGVVFAPVRLEYDARGRRRSNVQPPTQLSVQFYDQLLTAIAWGGKETAIS